MEVVPVDVKRLESNQITGFNAVFVDVIDGCFGPTGATKKFIDSIREIHTKGQPLAVFDTYMN